MMARKRARASEKAKPAVGQRVSKGVEKAAPGAGGASRRGQLKLLSMDQAIEVLKTTRSTFYRWLREGKVRGMKVGRQWRFEPDEIERFLKGAEPTIELRTDIGPLIRELEDKLGQAGDVEAGPTPVAHAVNLMLAVGADMQANDLHLLPTEGGVGISCRVDGLLHRVARFDPRLLAPVIEQFKRRAGCDVRQRTLPQDGRILHATGPGGMDLDVRASFVPSVLGESLTIRIIRRDMVSLKIASLGYRAQDRQTLIASLDPPPGVVLLTGPTGCGKTTAMYACLARLGADGQKKVMSAEDPVEYLIDGVVQVAVNEPEGLTFERAAVSFLRSGTDAMMIGEIRNREIAELCIQAALTGHLVLTALHTDNAASAVKRLTDMGIAPFLISDAVKLIVAQRLVRRLCTACSKPADVSGSDLERAEKMARTGGLDLNAQAEAKGFRSPVGCDQCRQMGYRGRLAIVEMLKMSPDLARAVQCGTPVDVLRKLAVAEGMTTIAADGVCRAADGETSLAEVFRMAPA